MEQQRRTPVLSPSNSFSDSNINAHRDPTPERRRKLTSTDFNRELREIAKQRSREEELQTMEDERIKTQWIAPIPRPLNRSKPRSKYRSTSKIKANVNVNVQSRSLYNLAQPKQKHIATAKNMISKSSHHLNAHSCDATPPPMCVQPSYGWQQSSTGDAVNLYRIETQSEWNAKQLERHESELTMEINRRQDASSWKTTQTMTERAETEWSIPSITDTMNISIVTNSNALYV
eukprot:CAMPEP_0202690128 /NCGR_PEP_ID=MMETSP1385-20130828/5227_1 /ASSEMBLY_ACC=CAM_ASM_000861 /TAXON_ID=933848 /ORGANISM="Elphidium margaritaceum" /LENGTH=231 /DNA_ID=CAMNT_0049345359 /DNA_START=75 /DNA_END=770 /DNA_ORIENTATION=-